MCVLVLLEIQLESGLCFLLFKWLELNNMVGLVVDSREYYRGVAMSDTARKRRHPEPTPTV
jgi:hypothetical protein